jgi:hypothetical protein
MILLSAGGRIFPGKLDAAGNETHYRVSPDDSHPKWNITFAKPAVVGCHGEVAPRNLNGHVPSRF